MLSPEEHELYSRHLLLEEVGLEGQLKLKNARVLVIGAGGLGCPVLKYLNAAGVGTIGISDHDTVDTSNLQRQILFSYSSVGKQKAEEAKKRLLEQNPFTKINTHLEGVNPQNISACISEYDIVVDCTDNYQSRYLINDACVLANKPLVYGAIHKFEGQVSVFNLNDGPSYRCLYPEIPNDASITSCSESGVIGVLPGIIGMLQANEVIKIIAEIGTTLSGKVLLYSALNNQMNSFNVSKKEHSIYETIRKSSAFNPDDYQISCSTISEIELDEIIDSKIQFDQIIDVRNPNELPILNYFSTIQIPLDEIRNRINEIDPDKKSLIFCKSGVRSRQAIEILQEDYNFKNAYNLKGGIMNDPSLMIAQETSTNE